MEESQADDAASEVKSDQEKKAKIDDKADEVVIGTDTTMEDLFKNIADIE